MNTQYLQYVREQLIVATADLSLSLIHICRQPLLIVMYRQRIHLLRWMGIRLRRSLLMVNPLIQ